MWFNLLLLVTISLCVTLSDSKIPKVDVLILGGGLSGLGAGITLIKANTGRLSFLILEADNRLGGRIKTVPMNVFKHQNQVNTSINVEEGGQWIHAKDNHLYEYAVEHQLIAGNESNEGLGSFIRNDRFICDHEMISRINYFVMNVLEKCKPLAMNGIAKCPASADAYLREEFRLYLRKLNATEKIIAGQILDWHMRFQMIDNSCLTLTELSAMTWAKYTLNGATGQSHFNFKRGFSDVISNLANEIGHQNIRLNKEVTNIEWKGSSSNSNSPSVYVTCADGTRYSASHAIITFSVGVLKTKLQDFTPSLPEPFAQTINDLGFGTIGKVILQFDDAWWGDDVKGIQFVWNNNFYEQHWTRYMTGFDVMHPNPKNTLLGWVGGYGVVEMESLTDTQIVRDCVAILSRFTGRPVPIPRHYVISRWGQNRFVRGSYSFTSTDNDAHGTYNHYLSAPITIKHFNERNHQNFRQSQPPQNNDNYPILLFAGEACHVHYFATAHGAFESGIEQASKILEYYSLMDLDVDMEDNNRKVELF